MTRKYLLDIATGIGLGLGFSFGSYVFKLLGEIL